MWQSVLAQKQMAFPPFSHVFIQHLCVQKLFCCSGGWGFRSEEARSLPLGSSQAVVGRVSQTVFATQMLSATAGVRTELLGQ